ncbi:unnamed protein product [Phytomonas sp. Hart1]|nr:unnamed protein product [Phytomonas sp. Hart1]|eukprot:CCW69715.1 unnamed protein product [Phytomonas sp. isolate Hart1]
MWSIPPPYHTNTRNSHTCNSNTSNLNQSSSSASCGDSNWASPTEVRHIRAACGALSQSYHKQLRQLKEGLRMMTKERDFYFNEFNKVKELKKSYSDGKRDFEKAIEIRKAWVGERAMMEVELERLMVENERLRWELRKRRKGENLLLEYRPAGAGGMQEKTSLQTKNTKSIFKKASSPSPAVVNRVEGIKRGEERLNEGNSLIPKPDFHSHPRLDPNDEARRLDHTLPLTQESFPEGHPHHYNEHHNYHDSNEYERNVAEGVGWPSEHLISSNAVILGAGKNSGFIPESFDSLPTPSTSVPSSMHPSHNLHDFASDAIRAPREEKEEYPNHQTTTKTAIKIHETSNDKNSSTPTYAINMSSFTLPTTTNINASNNNNDDTNTADNAGIDSSTAIKRSVSADVASSRGIQPSSSLVAALSNNHNISNNVINAMEAFREGFRNHSNKEEGYRTSPAMGTTNTTESTFSNVSSVPFLYHIPRTPADALKEELRLLQTIHQLTQENTLLKDRLTHLMSNSEVVWDRIQREVIISTNEHAGLKRQIRFSQDEADKLSLEVNSLRKQLEEACATVEAAQHESNQEKENHIEELRKKDEFHSKEIASMKLTQAAEVAGLRREIDDTAMAVDRARLSFQDELNARFLRMESERDDILKVSQEFEKRLSDSQRVERHLREELEAFNREKTTLSEHWGGEIKLLKEALTRANSEGSEFLRREKDFLNTFKEQNGRIQQCEEALATAEAHVVDLSEQLVTARRVIEEELPLWRLRAEALQTELVEVRSHDDAQLRVQHNVMTIMQKKHDREVVDHEKRYQELSGRLKAGKCRLMALQRGLFNSNPSSDRALPTAKKPQVLGNIRKTDQRENVKGDESENKGSREGDEKGNQLMVYCDPVESLLCSTAAVIALTGSIHRVN